MAKRERPVVVSTRVTPLERGLIAAIARAEGVSVCEVLHRLLMPTVRGRVSELLGDAGQVRPAAEILARDGEG